MFNRFFFDNTLTNFISTTGNNKISNILSNGGNYISEMGNFIRKNDNEIDTVSYIPIKKIVYDNGNFTWDHVADYINQDKFRVDIKIGRFIKKSLTKDTIKTFNITDKDIEDYVNMFKSYFTLDKNNLKIIEGEEVLKWYLEDNYAKTFDLQTGSLWRSCMRQSDRNKFMDLYAKNNDLCKLLIFLTDDGKLRARALLWDNVVDESGKTYKIMDRIYSIYEHDTFLFKSWASENGYITKLNQSANGEESFQINEIPINLKLRINLKESRLKYYPYLDTFKFFNYEDGYLTNSRSIRYDYELVQCDGGLEKQCDVSDDSEFYNSPFEDDEW